MTGLPLALVADVAQVDQLRPLLEARSCVLVGSAPLSAPVAVAPDDVVVAINGAISSAPRCDVWFVGSKAHDKPKHHAFMRPLHRLMLEQARGRHVPHAVFLRGPKVASEPYTLKTLRQLDCTIDAWSVIDKPTKRWLEGELCARRDDKQACSSGILAAACALWCGAASVRLVGFSLAPGYNYITEKRPPSWWRDHVESDRRALVALRQRYGSMLCGSLVEAVAA
jgi:hypothetical protein